MNVKEQKERMCKLITEVGRAMGCVPQCVCHLSDDMDLFGDNIQPIEWLESQDWEKTKKKLEMWEDMIQAYR